MPARLALFAMLVAACPAFAADNALDVMTVLFAGATARPRQPVKLVDV